MTCKKCGHPNLPLPENDPPWPKFCSFCGEEVRAEICPACHMLHFEGAIYCSLDGRNLACFSNENGYWKKLISENKEGIMDAGKAHPRRRALSFLAAAMILALGSFVLDSIFWCASLAVLSWIIVSACFFLHARSRRTLFLRSLFSSNKFKILRWEDVR